LLSKTYIFGEYLPISLFINKLQSIPDGHIFLNKALENSFLLSSR